MDHIELAKAALAFLARSSANGIGEARALIKVAEWLQTIVEGAHHSAPEPVNERATEA